MLVNTHIDAEERGHTMQVVGVVGHSQHFRYNRVLSPLCTKLLHQLCQVAGGCLSDSIYCHTQARAQVYLQSINIYTSYFGLKCH